jgi:4-amino-4-deoxy-L-arabinose transferase-like glycosyltransferase
MSHKPRTGLEWAAVTLLLLVAAWFRFYDLGDIPKGLEHDEVATWHMVAGVLEGERPIYFEEGYGHEPLYNYLTALPMAIWGDNWLGERFWAPWLGMFAVAATYALMRRLFGPLAGLSAGGYQATVLWAFFFNRLGLRLNLLPFLLCLTLYCFWRGLEKIRPPSIPPAKSAGGRKKDSPAQAGLSSSPPWAVRGGGRGGSSLSWFALAGLFMGACFYTYMSSRVVPLLVGAFSAYLIARDLLQPRAQRPTLRQLAARWWPLLVCFLVAALVMAPLALYLLDRPQDTETPQREGQVDYPLVELLRGNLRPVLQNAWAILKMWNFDGERYWQLNYSHRPVYVEPISGLLFWVGAAIAVWRWKEPRYALLVLWVALGMIPSLLTSEAPSWPRTMLASPAALAFPGIAAGWIAGWTHLRFGDRVRSRPLQILTQQIPTLLIVVSLALTAALTYRDYLIVWPQHPRVRFAFQSSLTEALRYLDRNASSRRAVVMAGLSPHDMDPWTERVTLRRDDLDVRWVDARSALVLPPDASAWFVTLDITPLDPALARWAGLDPALALAEGAVVPRGGTEDQDAAPVYYDPAYRVYALDAPRLRAEIAYAGAEAAVGSDALDPMALRAPPEFGGLVRLAGYRWLTPLKAGAPATLLTFWDLLDTGPSATRYGEPALRIFLHLLTPEQTVAAGVDVLGAAADTWQAGDLLVQLHRLNLPPQAGTYAVEVGWYVPPSGPRLPVDGVDAPGDRVLLAPAEVQ